MKLRNWLPIAGLAALVIMGMMLSDLPSRPMPEPEDLLGLSAKDIRGCMGKPARTAKLRGVPFDSYTKKGLVLFYDQNSEVYWVQFTGAEEAAQLDNILGIQIGDSVRDCEEILGAPVKIEESVRDWLHQGRRVVVEFNAERKARSIGLTLE